MLFIRKFLSLLDPNEKKHAAFLLCIILLSAIFDVIGVASIMPFIAVLANQQLIENNSILNSAYAFFNFKSKKDFLFVLGILVFFVLIFSLSIKALSNYLQTRFALMREYSIGKKLVQGYLNQPYEWFLNRHSADLSKTVLSEVASVVHGGMLPILTLLAQSALALMLLILLLIVDTGLALTVALVLGLSYAIVFKRMAGLLKKLGEDGVKANQLRYKTVAEAFGAAKEIKLAALEGTYIQRFSVPAEIYANGQSTAQVIAQLPRFVLEVIAFGGMLLVILYLMARSGGFVDAIPIVALYAFAGYRLMPALQQIYGSLTNLRYIGPALNNLCNELSNLSVFFDKSESIEALEFQGDMRLEKVYYTYPGAHRPALNNISLCISAKTTVGIVGATGSGKTTAVDLILGLLEPQAGVLTVDGRVIDSSNRILWQRLIGYVPQQIYLSDDSIEANIAFGVNQDTIDKDAVRRAATIANLHHFISNELSSGYQTLVGERGVRLSGGQRQRIGIARALYHNPKILIMDEATSALDNLTEQAVMDAVSNLNHEITIILIAHRLTTVRECDQIFLLDRGTVKAIGKYDELIAASDEFRAMTAND